MTERKILSRHEFPIRWVDIDVYNHLNNAKYYDFMTESRAQTFIKFMDECNFVVVENSCKYKLPIQYPNTIVVEQYLKKTSASCFECVYLFKMRFEEKVFAEGFAKIVCLEKTRMRPIKLPEKLKNFFGSCV